MELDRGIWYVRWFFWSLSIWDEFVERDRGQWMEEKGTNLCFFVRATLFYAPAVLVLHAILIIAAITAFVVLPVHFYGGSGYLLGIGTVVMIVLIIVGIVALVEYLKNQRRKKEQLQKEGGLVVADNAIRAAVKRGPSFWQILGEWLKAQKRKVCPLITFMNQEG